MALSGGKGPGGGHASDGGKRKGMAGTTRSNHPRGHEPEQVAVRLGMTRERIEEILAAARGKRDR